MDYLRKNLMLSLKKYSKLLIVLLILSLPLVIEDYLSINEGLENILKYVELNKVSSTNLVSSINIKLRNEYEIKNAERNLPLIVSVNPNAKEQISEIIEFINNIGGSLKEIKSINEIGFVILSKMPQRILTNIIEEVIHNIAIIDTYTLEDEYLLKLSNTRVLVSNNFITPRYVILYPFRSVEDVRNAIFSVLGIKLTPEMVYALSYALYSVGKPNVRFDKKEYQKIVQKYLESINIETINVSRGDVLLSKGEPIDESKVYLIKSYVKEVKKVYLVKEILTTFIIVAIALISILLISTFKNVRNEDIILINTILLIVPIYVQIFFSNNLGNNIIFLSSLPLFATLNSLICGRKSTFVLSLFYIFLLLLFIPLNYFLIVYWALLSAIIILLSGTITRRYEFILIAIIISITMAILIIPLQYIYKFELANPFQVTLMSFVSSFINVMILLLALPIFEYSFRLATPFNLYELASIENPLLRSLLEKAPGTYQHSQNVSILAEAAAEAIDANTLLAKAGALYHDIGKIYNPNYFTENIGGKTRKDVNIYQYTEIIKSHITKGVELARINRLPKEIENIILEHHSDSLIKYFYQQALKTSHNVDSDFFKYHNPKPRSKESAIIMLCDVIEARTRSEEDLSYEKIDNIVDDVISTKILEGHLDNSKLTFSEISKIKEAIKKTIRSLHHQRISYPEDSTPKPST